MEIWSHDESRQGPVVPAPVRMTGRWDLADDEATWAVTFAAGSIRDAAVPAGEAVALRIRDVVVAFVGLGARPAVTEVLYRGSVVVTEKRIMLVDEPGRQRLWDAGIEIVVAESDGCGAIVIPTPDALAAGARPWGLLPPSLLDPEPAERWVTLAGLVMWNRVVGAWRASRGELDQWVEQVTAAVRAEP